MYDSSVLNAFRQDERDTIPPATSRPVNLLRALNYDVPALRSGMFLKPPNPSDAPNSHADINHNGPSLPKHATASDHTYTLTSVVAHLGSVFSGHFVTYRRSPPVAGSAGVKHSDTWLYASDMDVRRVSLEEVLSSEAYMLFYERV
jgi:uncharacterized UBP type Zn finger protein